ncbi:Helix-turn-helix protein [Halobacteroides halobius DSM 5150]|uniref:Helix-turn-helix protein n=1 Tax=Halobacteroides halobius (strain ATCC 35273 / DSM 5150 / MD-1) TaxID=748449 RepID=L0K8M5_HALHC|nr:helix-turn-helix domain-containing protein [Halobacteroides halobius]AGB40714.1 Helix-turn-helix protein [Halobacteroides halobius DSM 5150]
MEEIATKLKNQREQLGITLKEAAKDTKIRLEYLQAIESGNFSNIGQEVFLKGFLKIYSDYLNLDTKEIIAEYEAAKSDYNLDSEDQDSLADKLSMNRVSPKL